MSIDVTPGERTTMSARERQEAVSDLITLLRSWSEGDEEDAREQSETFAKLMKGIRTSSSC